MLRRMYRRIKAAKKSIGSVEDTLKAVFKEMRKSQERRLSKISAAKMESNKLHMETRTRIPSQPEFRSWNSNWRPTRDACRMWGRRGCRHRKTDIFTHFFFFLITHYLYSDDSSL